jgi:hypothetical protein
MDFIAYALVLLGVLVFSGCQLIAKPLREIAASLKSQQDKRGLS